MVAQIIPFAWLMSCIIAADVRAGVRLRLHCTLFPATRRGWYVACGGGGGGGPATVTGCDDVKDNNVLMR